MKNIRITPRRRREIILLPTDENRKKRIDELENTLDRLVMKFSSVDGWALAGGDAARINTGGEYHRMLEEIEIVVWDHALLALIERGEELPRRYALMSRKGMANIPLSGVQIENYRPVNRQGIITEIENCKSAGDPRGARRFLKRLTYRNLRFIETDERKNRKVTRDNSIDVRIIYQIKSKNPDEGTLLICPDTKMVMPADQFSVTTYQHVTLLNPRQYYRLPVVSTPFLCAQYQQRNKSVDRYDLGIIRMYHQKIKQMTESRF